MTFADTDATALCTLLREVARAEIMPRFGRLDPADIRAKSSPHDLVTVADEAAERLITADLQARYPGCLVVGEEATAAQPELLQGLARAEVAFVVDPIDGTANYCAGIPLFGTMAAALVRGQVVMAAIHDPLTDTTAVALHGQGAWMLHADGSRTPMRVAEPVPMSEMAGCVSWRYMKRPLRDNVCRNMQHMASVADYRCAAHQYRMLASGTLHCLVFNRLMPWDHAPGWLLHQEAGGFSAQWDGTPYDPSITTGGLLCTPDQASWTTLRDGLLAD